MDNKSAWRSSLWDFHKTDTEINPAQVSPFPSRVFVGIIGIDVTAATIRSDASSPLRFLWWGFGFHWLDMLCRVRNRARSISRSKLASMRFGLFA